MVRDRAVQVPLTHADCPADCPDPTRRNATYREGASLLVYLNCDDALLHNILLCQYCRAHCRTVECLDYGNNNSY